MDVSENRRYKPDESRIQEILCKTDVCKGNRRGKDRAGVSLRKDCFLLELPQWKDPCGGQRTCQYEGGAVPAGKRGIL